MIETPRNAARWAATSEFLARQGEPDVRAGIEVCRMGASPMGPCDHVDDGQAQPRALARARRGSAAEGLEGVGDEGLGESVPLVSHVELDAAVDRDRLEQDASAAVAE